VVTSSTEENDIVAGIPAKVVGTKGSGEFIRMTP